MAQYMDIESIEKKWEGLLEGLSGKMKRATAIMIENQFNDLHAAGMISEAGETQGSFQRNLGYGGSGDFHKIAVPMVRRTFPELICHDLVGVQPMTAPVGIAFALRFRAGQTYSSQSNQELGYNTIDSTYSGTYLTSAGERLGSYTPGSTTGTNGIATAPGLGVGTGTAINEVQFTLEKTQVTANTRKLRSRWSLEVAQDLKAMHGLNIEDEMMDILAYEVSAEIDREIIASIRTAADSNAYSHVAGKLGTLSWTSSANFDGRWEHEKYRNLYNRAVRQANRIAILTRRGAGNWIVANPTLCAAFEGSSSFTIAPVSNNVDTAKTGVAFIGTLDSRLKLYRDTFCATDEYVVGYKGSSAYDAGIIYLPYVQLQVAKATFEDSYNPTIGLMSRYAIMNSLWGSSNFYIRNEITGMP